MSSKHLKPCGGSEEKLPLSSAAPGYAPSYKPVPLRWPYLLGLLLVLSTLMGLLELSCHVLPLEGAAASVPAAGNAKAVRVIVDRPQGSDVLSASSADSSPTPTDKPVEKPTDKPTEKPTDESAEKPTGKSADAPTDKPTDKPEGSKPQEGGFVPSPTSSDPQLYCGKEGCITPEPCKGEVNEDGKCITPEPCKGEVNEDGKCVTDKTESKSSSHHGLGAQSKYASTGSIAVTVSASGIESEPTPHGGGGAPLMGTHASLPETTTPYMGGQPGGGEIPSRTDNPAGPTTVRDPVRPTTLDGVVTTILAPTTLNGVVTTVAGVTTLGKIESTFTGRTTVGGKEQTYIGTTTLENVVSSFSDIKTLAAMVTMVPLATTLDGVVRLAGVSYGTPKVVTLTDSRGVPTATSTIVPAEILTPTVVTLTDSLGRPTATVTTSAPIPPTVITLRDSDGVPTLTITEYAARPTSTATSSSSTPPNPGNSSTGTGGTKPPKGNVHVYVLTGAQYFVGFFLPTILSVLLTIPMRMIDLSAKQFQPFHALAREDGAPGDTSLCLQTGGFHCIAESIRSLFGGQALVFLTTLLMACSIFLVPLSSEAVFLELHGSCSASSFQGCAMTLAVSPLPARATIALLCAMMILLGVILLVLRNWESGVGANPWSIASVAVLGTNPDVRALMASVPVGPGGKVGQADLLRIVGTSRFRVGYFTNEDGSVGYGITLHGQPRDVAPELAKPAAGPGRGEPSLSRPMPLITLSYLGRIAFLLFISGLLIVILYYNLTFDDTPFERFMDTHSFGVRFLFTMVGVCVTFFWTSFFTNMAALSPYYLLWKQPQRAERSILLSTPTNAFSGLWSAVQRRDWWLAVVAFTAILSEFMPVLLNNIPMRITQTWLTHLVCTWSAVSILGLMWLVVLGTFFLAWPPLPADPTTIAGAMYYVCDSPVLEKLEGLGMLAERERNERIRQSGLRFDLGRIVGVSGAKRIAVDGHHGVCA